jgi:hypothetical protein
MRAAVLLGLTFALLSPPDYAHAEMQPGRVLLAQRILSCGEQANTWYILYTGMKCNTGTPTEPDKCKPLMDNICALGDKCERAKVFCVKPPVVAK